MARNLELKARCRSLAAAERTARSLGGRRAGVLHQTDTYFAVPAGRMKMRSIGGKRVELIYYDRPTTTDRGGRWSLYVVYPVSQPRRMRTALRTGWKVRAVVRKRRTLYLIENARIHLDAVEGLGNFIEFEVMLERGNAQAERLYRRLRTAFNIRRMDMIGGSYADMIRPLRRKR